MKIGLFFGTFNPIHIGHLIIANYLAEFSNIDEVWFVITPLSPFKQKKTILNNHHRLAMVNIAVEDFPKLKATDIEFNLPLPNYTINTLIHLEEKYPSHQFSLIIGEDNLNGFHKWKSFETILEQYELIVYPRISENSADNEMKIHPNIKKTNAPIVQISSTFIRNSIKEKKDIRSMLPINVWKYIDEMNFYKK
ncbi:nicotinate (nicotinamide) nucleotide adenylyltransferase [Lutibacter sp.]|uniref:nicotinate (nicotinamide) nucleotide adenylyltransferase n=1 Tax=Lutibacter sp. TaxID=1925666 RepID=UPI002734400D|nr:nicotinate (nicotinamide) nucleotide adenylyltransferase [Lutibacter sp.]MDP3314287.1 nicotinate (nicotinamide) nucleotide adenylyltransferase [Lutibacter sp.]